MWDLPGPGLKPMLHALASRFLTTAPPGKSDLFLRSTLPGVRSGIQRRTLPTPTTLRLVSKQVLVTTEPNGPTAFLPTLELQGKSLLDFELCSLCILSSLGFIRDLFKGFVLSETTCLAFGSIPFGTGLFLLEPCWILV